ncbi:MAG: TIM barrel protein [Patescibacteria group bacterium]
MQDTLKIHNAVWPGLVGKGSPGAEPFIDLDTMLDLTANAEVNGVKFDGVDLFAYNPHIDIDISDDGIKALADKIRAKNLMIGSIVAPVWFDGNAMGGSDKRAGWVTAVRKTCRIAHKLREIGARPCGIVRIDSACNPEDWSKDPAGNTKLIAKTFQEGGAVAAEYGERLAAEGEICWGGMHSWRHMVDLLEETDRPGLVGFQADMAHTLLYALGHNAPEHRLLPLGYNWTDPGQLDEALRVMTRSLRPWTIDFHVAQNDGTVKGGGNHDNTGKHCPVDDQNGKLDIVRHAGYWMRNGEGYPVQSFGHICWDGCLFPNEVLLKQETYNKILTKMIAVRETHGW